MCLQNGMEGWGEKEEERDGKHSTKMKPVLQGTQTCTNEGGPPVSLSDRGARKLY